MLRRAIRAITSEIVCCSTGRPPRGEVAAFLAGGFTLNENIVLTAECIREAAPPEGVVIGELREAAQWNAFLQFQLRMRDARFEPRAYETFMRRRCTERQKLCRDGGGAWIGAFCDGGLVGNWAVSQPRDRKSAPRMRGANRVRTLYERAGFAPVAREWALWKSP
ncbi:MAG: hypothetical protein ACXVAG_01640 [Vulcanimicrobiaceae bacterium]